jgi:hypothetical protein
MRRLFDPRLWSLETRLAMVVLLPSLLIVVLFIDSQGGRWLAFWVLMAVRWLVIAPWARRQSRSDTARTDTVSP